MNDTKFFIEMLIDLSLKDHRFRFKTLDLEFLKGANIWVQFLISLKSLWNLR